MNAKERKIAERNCLARLQAADPALAKEIREMWAQERIEAVEKRRAETADIRSVAAKDRAAYAARRKEVIASGKWLPPVPSLGWFVTDETEERRVAECF